MLITFAVQGYRSLRRLELPLQRLNIVTGPNGSGKSNLYRALRLSADIAQGRVIGSLAAEGGLSSTLWAGPEKISRRMKSGEVPVQGTVRSDVVSLKLGFADEDYGYAIDLGLPVRSSSAFGRDPEIKTEYVWAGEKLRRSNIMAARRGPAVEVLEDGAGRSHVFTDLPSYYSMMTHAADPRRTPELLALRERMQSWRFYDHFRTDRDAPARQPQIGTRTPVMASDGSDFAAALQTILEIGDHAGLDAAINDAFPDAELGVTSENGLFEVVMRQPGMLRPLRAAELSDGTLRFCLLATALLSPRAPGLLVLNEPETSLHPDLLDPLARLIIRAAENTQVIVVSHAGALVDALAQHEDAALFELSKELGETVVADVDPPAWEWPKR